MRRLTWVLPVICGLLAGSLTAAASRAGEADTRRRELSGKELAALLDRVEAKLGTVRSLRASFVQEKHLSIFTDVVEAEGVLLFQRPGAVRFEITKPFRSVLIASGKSAAKYEFIDGRWHKMKQGGAAAVRMVTEQIASWLAGRLREKADTYAISATAADAVTITLTPRDKKFREFVTAIELTLSTDETHFTAVVIREPGGDFTRTRYVAPRHNVALPKGLFDTTGPAPQPLGTAGGAD